MALLELLEQLQIKFDKRLIDLCYKAKMEELQTNENYLTKAEENLKNRLDIILTRKNAVLDLFIDGKIEKNVFDIKSNSLNNEEVEIKKELSELKGKIGSKGKETLERIKEVFLYPVNKEKGFLKIEDEKKEKVIKTLLWNASFKNQKIACFSFKEPYDILSKVENKSNFSKMLPLWDKFRMVDWGRIREELAVFQQNIFKSPICI